MRNFNHYLVWIEHRFLWAPFVGAWSWAPVKINLTKGTVQRPYVLVIEVFDPENL